MGVRFLRGGAEESLCAVQRLPCQRYLFHFRRWGLSPQTTGHIQEESQDQYGFDNQRQFVVIERDGANGELQVGKELPELAGQQGQSPASVPDGVLRNGVEPATDRFQRVLIAGVREIVPAERDHRRAEAMQQACARPRESRCHPILITEGDIAARFNEVKANTAGQPERKSLDSAAHTANEDDYRERLHHLFNKRGNYGKRN